MGLAVVALLILVVIAIIAIPIFARLFGEAASRNPNRAENEEDRERESGEQRPGSSS